MAGAGLMAVDSLLPALKGGLANAAPRLMLAIFPFPFIN